MGATVLYRHLCLYTTVDTDATHTVHAAAYQYHSLLVSCLSYALFMVSTLLYRLLCQHHQRHWHYTHCSNCCMPISIALFVSCLGYALFMVSTFTVQALVSAPPPTLHTQFMQLPVSINYHFLLVCGFLLMLFLWVPLYCTDTNVSITTDTTHTVPAAVVSFSPCLYLHMQAAVSQKFLILQPKR